MGALKLSTTRKAKIIIKDEDTECTVFFQFPFMEELLKEGKLMYASSIGEVADSSLIYSEITSYITGWKDIQGTNDKELPFTEDNAKSVMEYLVSQEKLADVLILMQGVTAKN